MDATIYLSDDFKVKGITIEHNNVTMFSYGQTCSYQTFHKTIPADNYTAEVLELIKLKEKYNYHRGTDFTHDFFEVFQSPENLDKRYKWTKEYKDNHSVHFGKFNDIAKEIEAKIWNIINKIK